MSQPLLYLPPYLPHNTVDNNTSRHLSSADAERVESRLKKIQLQQLYAKQLSDDASALNATPSGRKSNSSDGSRRISSARIDPGAASQIISSSGIESKGVHGSAKASQLEYYQQLQDDENVRAQHHADPQTTRRASLYRTRDQKEQIDARGWSRDDRSTPQSVSSPLVGGGRDIMSGSGYGLEDGRGRYQDQVQDPGYIGYGSAKAMQRNIVEGDVNSSSPSIRLSQGQREREEQRQGDLDEFYSRTPHSIGESIRVKDTYGTQRDLDHGRGSYSSGGNNNSNSNNNSNISRSVTDGRQRGAYSQPADQDRDMVQDRYEHGGGDDRYQERMSSKREDSQDQYRYNDSELRVNQIRERDDDYSRHMDQMRVREEELRYQEKEAMQRSGRLEQSSSAYEPSRGAPSHMRLSESRIRSEDPPLQMNSGRRSYDYGGDGDRERDRDMDRGRDRDRDEYPSGQVRNYERTSNVDDASMYDSYSPSYIPQRIREVNSNRLSDQSNRQQMNYPVLDGHSSQYGGSGSGHSPGTGTGTGYDRDGRSDGECLSTLCCAICFLIFLFNPSDVLKRVFRLLRITLNMLILIAVFCNK